MTNIFQNMRKLHALALATEDPGKARTCLLLAQAWRELDSRNQPFVASLERMWQLRPRPLPWGREVLEEKW